MFRLEKIYNYLTGLGLILLDIGLGLIELINQAWMLLQKYEDFLEISVEQLVTQSSIIFVSQTKTFSDILGLTIFSV